METAIKNFAKQFNYEPQVENKKTLKKYSHFLVLGMGGSHLAADILLSLDPTVSLTIHSDYGLPTLPKALLGDTLVIASSYSGNTEEVIDGLELARKKKLPVAVIAVGGKLIELAEKYRLPYIKLPDTGIQPRSALGFSLLALLKVMGKNALIKEAHTLTRSLQPARLEKEGLSLAEKIKNTIPVIYASSTNRSLAYNWKIKLNETGKIPAFYNVFPELNHNEMTGFDVREKSKLLSKDFTFIFLQDVTDHPKNQKRLKVLTELYCNRGLRVEVLKLGGKNSLQKIFSSLILADWVAVHTAAIYGLESEQVPMVEEFKKLIK